MNFSLSPKANYFTLILFNSLISIFILIIIKWLDLKISTFILCDNFIFYIKAHNTKKLNSIYFYLIIYYPINLFWKSDTNIFYIRKKKK